MSVFKRFGNINSKNHILLLRKKSKSWRFGGKVKIIPDKYDKPGINPLESRDYVKYDPITGWKWRESRRTGLLAIKLGMTHKWDNFGVMTPLTVLKVENCQVLQVKTIEKDGYIALKVGAGTQRLKKLNKVMMGIFVKAGVSPKRYIEEFKVSSDAILPVGTEITVRHFLPGQGVDVSGISIGKGFQGAVKRWGFAGGPASHGTSLAHRTLGATGARQNPSKVWKGKKMAGRMGGDRIIMKNLKIFEIRPLDNLLLVKGAVPGSVGTCVRVTDSVISKFKIPPPFPTFFPKENEEIPKSIKATFPNPFVSWVPNLESEFYKKPMSKKLSPRITGEILKEKESKKQSIETTEKEKEKQKQESKEKESKEKQKQESKEKESKEKQKQEPKEKKAKK